jgi:hypothetical protein
MIPTASAPSGITRVTLLKDLRLEWRSKDAINSMLFFSLLVVVVFSFSFDPSAEESRQIAGGLVWVAFLFAAVVALNQTWAREIRNQVLDAYRVSPAPANSLFIGEDAGQFYFCQRAGSADDSAVYCVLPAALAWPGLAVAAGSGVWHLGTGRQRDFFCGDVIADTQPRDHAAAAFVPDFYSGAARHGAGDYRDTQRGRRAFLDCVAWDLRSGVYYSLPAVV